MKKLFTLLATLIVFTLNAQVTREWAQTDSSANHYAIAKDNNSNVYVTGQSNATSMLLKKYDATGTLLWSQTFLPAGATKAQALAITLDAAGNVLVSGWNHTTAGGCIVKYDNTGQLLWSQSVSSYSRSIVTDEANNVYVHFGTGNTLQTVKFNASGVQQWSTSYVTASTAYAVDGFIGKKMFYKAGSLYIAGQGSVKLNTAGWGVRTILTLKYNTVNGVLAWANNYNHADKINQYGVDLTVDNSGNSYVAGQVSVKAGKNENPNWVLLKYNDAGALQWTKIYDGTGPDYANPGSSVGFDVPKSVTSDAAGNIIVAGTLYTTTGSFTSQDMAIQKYNASGTLLWTKTFDNADHLDDDARGVATDASSNIYVTGSSSTSVYPVKNGMTIKYNASGALVWSIGEASVTPLGICLDNTNVYIITGALLVKYSQAFAKAPMSPVAMEQQFKLYPNPASNFLNVSATGNITWLTITDISGRQVMMVSQSRKQFDLNISTLAPGIYFLQTSAIKTPYKFIKQ